MKHLLLILVVGLATISTSFAQQGRTQTSPEETELWEVFQQITDITASELEVPAELYARYFRLDSLVHPDQYGRMENSSLDQFTDLCPGGVVLGPDSGMTYTFSTNGNTNTATNNCSTPNGRLGKDVFLVLEVFYRDSITVTTCGSGFDTYLAIFQNACCTQAGATLWESNDNAPDICGIATTLQAGITRCFEPGTYYICLDGRSPAAQGAYRCSVIFHGNSCIQPNNDPVCPVEFATHEETAFPEGCSEFSNVVNCNQGYCGTIDTPGDLDVYALTVTGCEREVVISVYADDTEGRTGFEGGLDSELNVWPVTCEAPLSTNHDYNGGEGFPVGTDSQITINLAPGTYFFVITGENATSGPYEMFLSCSTCEQ